MPFIAYVAPFIPFLAMVPPSLAVMWIASRWLKTMLSQLRQSPRELPKGAP